MPAELIWDNARPMELRVPGRMGKPAAHQLQGSPLDNLAELAGRVCYDSLGAEKSRSSAEYHAHIREVQHLSVYRHCAFTVQMSKRYLDLLHNRPGLFVWHSERPLANADVRVTLNLQHVLEWRRPKLVAYTWEDWNLSLARLVASAGSHLAPLACGPLALDIRAEPWRFVESSAIKIVPPEVPEERWLSFYIDGVSRGLTHELVRHGAYTAPSQRSTRYCDEAESPWVWHPLINTKHGVSASTHEALELAQDQCRHAYRKVVDDLRKAGHELKQARGAARGVLGNALETELIFSASLARWREIGALRNNKWADKEIQELFAQIESMLPAD